MIQQSITSYTSEGGGTVDEYDALHVWADIDTHLQFIDQVIQKSNLPDQARTTLLERMQHIRLRRADPNMYLAVVGEFSTGKSTFINALLGEELLKTAVDVTTATSTRLCYGPYTNLEVRFRNMEKTFSYRQNRRELWQHIQTLSSDILGEAEDIHTYINAVTTNNTVASQVENAVIHHPAPFLTNGIVIIDTPGINAEHTAHAQTTYNVVRHEADAAVVIIPAPVPLAQTLTTFLTEQLRPFLHRCVFVVTQMDKIQEREQKRLFDNIRTRLTKILGVEQPVVLYDAAPQVVLDMMQEQAVPSQLQCWNTRFHELEQSIWDRLRRERALSITESLLRLMTALFEELNTHLRARRSSYEARQVAIQRETIQDIASFTAQQQQEYQGKLTSTVASIKWGVEQLITEQRNKIEESIRQAIFGADSAEELKSVMANTVKAQLQAAGNAFQKDLRTQVKSLEHITMQASRSFDTRFAQEYQKLQTLAGTVSFSAIANSDRAITVNTSSISYSVDKVNGELDGVVNTLGWGGAAAGAVIGTMLLPGVGTVAGAFLGPILVGVFGPSLYDRKTKVWDEVQPALRSNFVSMSRQAQATLNSYESEVQFAFAQRINAYMQQYKSTVDKMIQQQQRELATIKRLQQTVQSDQQEITRRRDALKQKQQQLTQKYA